MSSILFSEIRVIKIELEPVINGHSPSSLYNNIEVIPTKMPLKERKGIDELPLDNFLAPYDKFCMKAPDRVTKF